MIDEVTLRVSVHTISTSDVYKSKDGETDETENYRGEDQNSRSLHLVLGSLRKSQGVPMRVFQEKEQMRKSTVFLVKPSDKTLDECLSRSIDEEDKAHEGEQLRSKLPSKVTDQTPVIVDIESVPTYVCK